MLTRFAKMHGAGNDFVILDGRTAALPPLTPRRAAALADRRRGIGCDQLISLEPAYGGEAAMMRIHNPDGSEAGACGNATRCVAALLGAIGPIRLRTRAGLLQAEALGNGQVRVGMGRPGLAWQDVPLVHAADTLHLPLVGDPAGLSMGNPHATWFVDDVDVVERQGAAAELDPLFADRVNAGFAQVLAPDRIRLRVWERGAGLTLACGSGACAALVNAHRRGLAGRQATLVLDGGELLIEWRADDMVWMTGPTVTAFTGELDLADYPA